MANRINKIMINGKEVEVEEIEVTSASEQWCKFLLEDGSTLKLKLVLTKVFRLVNQYDNDGQPCYIAQSVNVVCVTPFEELKKNDSIK